MRLALAQLAIEDGAVSTNRDAAIDAIETAAAEGADLVLLPEIFTVGYFAFEDYASASESLTGPSLSRISRAARTNDIAVLAGSIVEDLAASAAAGFAVPAESGLANTAVFFDAKGERRGTYRKHHLFGYESAEADLLHPGESLSVFDFREFTIGITTCYDLRFPELYRTLLDRGVTLTLVPSAWPYPRVEHWRTLPRARAIENLMYVATVNGTQPGSDQLLGRSAVYDPWGTVLASAGTDPTVLTTEVKAEWVDDIRTEFPALSDRRE